METSNVNNLNGVPNFGHGMEDETITEASPVEEAEKVEESPTEEEVETQEAPASEE